MSAAAHRWNRLCRTAQAQSGLVSLAQLHAAGFSTRTASRLAANGQLTRRHRGVYVVGPVQPGFAANAWAAHLALGVAHPISHVAAGFLLGLLPGRRESSRSRSPAPEGARDPAFGSITPRLPSRPSVTALAC